MNLIAFIPAKALENVRDLINKHELNIITVSERKTKRGDFRVYSNGAKKITLNKDSNKFRFLITFLHETAHQLVFQTFGNKIRPHGIEWKIKFKEIELKSLVLQPPAAGPQLLEYSVTSDAPHPEVNPVNASISLVSIDESKVPSTIIISVSTAVPVYNLSLIHI